MANSANYTATKEDARPWRSGHDTLANANDEAAVANAAAIQADTHAASPVTAISVAPATDTLAAEETVQLVVTTTPADQGVSVTYESSDPTKATVDSDGLVTAVASGEATITVTAVHDNAQTDTSVITVS